jgi:hypothetical protein
MQGRTRGVVIEGCKAARHDGVSDADQSQTMLILSVDDVMMFPEWLFFARGWLRKKYWV